MDVGGSGDMKVEKVISYRSTSRASAVEDMSIYVFEIFFGILKIIGGTEGHITDQLTSQKSMIALARSEHM